MNFVATAIWLQQNLDMRRGMSKTHYFGAAGETNVQVTALAILAIAVILIAVLPRKYCFIPLLFATIFIPGEQQVILGSIHLNLARILLLSGWIRLLWVRFTGGPLMPRMNALDYVFTAYCFSNAIAYSLLWGELGALVNRLGFLYNAFGTYFFMRYFIREVPDWRRLVQTFAWCMMILGALMAVEEITGQNQFAIVGAIKHLEMREGRVRAQGPFAHALTAGTVGATLFPLFPGLWWQGRKWRMVAVIGCFGSFLVTFCTAASTPLLGLAAGIFALCLWRFRRYLRLMFGGLLVIVLALHLAMKAPVWALIERIDLTGSSSSYHRYELVNQFILRFWEWCAVGTQHTYEWGWDMWDTSNSYVAAGTSGGLITLILFLAIFAVGFRRLGNVRKKWHPENRKHAWWIWSVGSMLFATFIAFWGVEYFDQSTSVWYTLIAMIASVIAVGPHLADRQGAKPAHVVDTLLSTSEPAPEGEKGAIRQRIWM